MIQGQIKQEGKVTVFQIHDDLTTDRVKSFLKRTSELLEEGRIFLILDLSEVEEVSLLAMVAMSSLFNKCRAQGGSLKISGLTSSVRRSFRNTNLINTIEVYEETLDALKSFKSHNLLKSKNYSGSFFLKEKNAFVGWDRLPMTGPIQ